VFPLHGAKHIQSSTRCKAVKIQTETLPTAVQHLAMEVRQKGAMKRPILALSLFAAPLFAEDTNRQEDYNSLLSCAAFYTIEATKVKGDASEANQATAYDFAGAAAKLAPDGSVATANADLAVLLKSFREKLDKGEVRAMAEAWTTLESGCRDLHRVKDRLVKTHVPVSDVER
jgi:hypothetical protein